MRLRHIPGSEEEIANSPYVVSNPEEKKAVSYTHLDVYKRQSPNMKPKRKE